MKEQELPRCVLDIRIVCPLKPFRCNLYPIAESLSKNANALLQEATPVELEAFNLAMLTTVGRTGEDAFCENENPQKSKSPVN